MKNIIEENKKLKCRIDELKVSLAELLEDKVKFDRIFIYKFN